MNSVACDSSILPKHSSSAHHSMLTSCRLPDLILMIGGFQVLAGVTAVGQDEIRFLDLNSVLWSKTASSKTTGKQSWPFSITLPTDTTVSERGKKQQQAQTYPLPPSFSERASPAYIDYRLVVTVKRSSFRVNQTYCSSFFGACWHRRSRSPTWDCAD